MNDKPGKELPKDYRAVAAELVANQGWGYKVGSGHSMLYPADPSQRPVTVGHSPSDHRAFRNFTALVRRAGGIWPPRKAS